MIMVFKGLRHSKEQNIRGKHTSIVTFIQRSHGLEATQADVQKAMMQKQPLSRSEETENCG